MKDFQNDSYLNQFLAAPDNWPFIGYLVVLGRLS